MASYSYVVVVGSPQGEKHVYGTFWFRPAAEAFAGVINEEVGTHCADALAIELPRIEEAKGVCNA